MKGFSVKAIGCRLSAVSFCLLLVLPTQAQNDDLFGRALFTFNGGATYATSNVTNQGFTGTLFTATAEWLTNENWAWGFNGGYGWGVSSFEEDENKTYRHWTIPLLITSRYMFFGRQAFKPYIGLGAGLLIGGGRQSGASAGQNEVGLGASVPVGFFWFLGHHIHLSANVAPIWSTATNDLKENTLFFFTLGLGYRP